MELNFGIDQYRMSSKLSKRPKIGRIVSRTLGTLNIGQYARADIFKSVVRKLPMNKMERVLDLGCGQGEYSLMMARAFPHIKFTSLDIEKERLDKITKIINDDNLTNIQTHHGMVESIEKDEQFDLVYSIDVFEHIDVNHMPFEQTYKKLKKGGFAFIKMPNITQRTVLPQSLFESHNQWLDDEHIGQVYNLTDLENRMKKEGFKIVKSFYADGLISRFAWELWFLAKKVRPELQIILLPFLKPLVKLDRLFANKKTGNTIQVLAQKL